MYSTVFTKKYESPYISIEEIRRYAGIDKLDGSLDAIIIDCLSELQGKLNYNVCYRYTRVEIIDSVVDLGFMKAKSESLAKNLKGCDQAVIFAAGIGLGIDRLISRYSGIDTSRALVLQAIGAERVESLCDIFCRDLKIELQKEKSATRPRFSVGYGDLSLEFQKDIFAFLSPNKYIGLSLNDSLMMSPSKSVTAIVGIFKEYPIFCRVRLNGEK